MSERSGLRAVIDTNLFVSGMLNPHGQPGRLLDLWRAGRFQLLLSDWQYAELCDVFSRAKIIRNNRITQQALVEFFTELSRATIVILSANIPLPLRDSNDEPILASAIGGNAECLVTGDLDLLVLRDDPRLGALRIVTAAQFLELLEQQR